MLTGLAVNGWISNRSLTNVARQHVEHSVAGISKISDIISDVKEMRIIVYSYYNAVTAEDRTKLVKRMADASEQLDTHVKAFGSAVGASMAGDVARMAQIKDRLDDVNGRTFAAVNAGDGSAIKLIKGEGKERSHDAIDQAQAMLEKVRNSAKDANASGQAMSWLALCMTIGVSMLTLIGLVAVWLMINRTVARPMAQLAGITKTLAEGGNAVVPSIARGDELGEIARAVEQFRSAAIARSEIDARAAAEQRLVTDALRDSLTRVMQGDLTADVTADFPPAYAELKTNLNAALAGLRDMIGSVLESTASIRTGSDEIASASEDLARRTETNAASLEETAAAVTQMDQRLRTTATAANGTVQRADHAIGVVSSGRKTADEAVQAMTRVADNAKGIDSVIEGLDKIAFQTRVLAMNAAVEAGRAGEAGRGFAVVADLVSALAMRAEEEAGRARNQLTATQADIVTAVGMVEKVDGELARITTNVSEVHQLLGGIASDNQAQSAAVTQISQTIGAMDQSTQQNAAMVEQTSAAARNLTAEVAALAQRAERFNIGAGAPQTSLRRSIAARPETDRRIAASGYVSPVKPLAIAAADSGDSWASF
ncbi:methyl-accepting chemotaxis protein [Sphingomonas pokkalii]|uniref:methyl-accepting chemotaxis protein n=1 Tax=Sphingomonas pokkalii TaxID=2175090 RepID=UPI003F5E6C69